MPRTVTAKLARPGKWLVWGTDSGGPAYAFGMHDMMAGEHVRAFMSPSGAKVDASFRLYDDVLGVEMRDGATYPDEIEIAIETYDEGMARIRAEVSAS